MSSASIYNVGVYTYRRVKIAIDDEGLSLLVFSVLAVCR